MFLIMPCSKIAEMVPGVTITQDEKTLNGISLTVNPNLI